MLAQQVQGRNELRATAELNEPSAPGAVARRSAAVLANRRKDEFLTMLAHDLCGPLAAVRHVVRLWGNQKGEDATSERMQALIERQLGRLTGIVDELQAVSKLDSDTLHLQRERLDLRDVVCRAIETLEWDIRRSAAIVLPWICRMRLFGCKAIAGVWNKCSSTCLPTPRGTPIQAVE